MPVAVLAPRPMDWYTSGLDRLEDQRVDDAQQADGRDTAPG